MTDVLVVQRHHGHAVRAAIDAPGSTKEHSKVQHCAPEDCISTLLLLWLLLPLGGGCLRNLQTDVTASTSIVFIYNVQNLFGMAMLSKSEGRLASISLGLMSCTQ